jgi:hypothetical protein
MNKFKRPSSLVRASFAPVKNKLSKIEASPVSSSFEK